jgi:hypothetical protein
MKINNIEVKEMDTKFTLKPTRTGLIKVGSTNIRTPLRAANQYEYNCKARVPTDILVNSEINLKFKNLSYNNLAKLLTENEPFASIHRAQENANDIVKHTLLNFSVFQPSINSEKKKDPVTGEIKVVRHAAMEILEQETELDKFLDLIIALQESLNFDVITIPYLKLPYSIIEAQYKKRAAQIRKAGKEPFFIIDLKHTATDFEKIITLLVKDLQVRLVGLLFKRFKDAALNYRLLSKYYSKDVLFFTLQVGRYDTRFDNISSFHYMPFLVNDIFVLAAPRGHSKEESGEIGGSPGAKSTKAEPLKVESYQDRLAKLKLFNKRKLTLDGLTPIINNYKDLLGDVGNSDDARLTEMLRNYATEGNDEKETEERYRNLNAFTRVHELKISSAEFAKFRSHIEKSDTESYVSSHPILSSTVPKLK